MMSRILVSALLAAAAFGGEIPARTAALGKQIASAEKALDRHFRSAGAGTSIALIGAARGVYLPQYGAVFLIEVNLAPVANVSPFRRSYSEEGKATVECPQAGTRGRSGANDARSVAAGRRRVDENRRG